MKRAYLISGGVVNKDFAREELKKRRQDDLVVAIDAGLEILHDLSVRPDVMVGDFDTVNYDILDKYIDDKEIIIERHNPIKDLSDTQLAVDTCARLGYHEIFIIGAFGGRIDHVLANIYLTCTALDRDIYITLIDEYNKIYAVDHNFRIKKAEQWGNYLSIYNMGDAIKDFSIKGVKYPADNIELNKYKNPSYTISNEIIEDVAEISFPKGLILVIESKDRKSIKII